MANPLKGYNADLEVKVKYFNKKGEELEKVVKKSKSERLFGKLGGKDKIIFSKIESASIDTSMDIFGADIDKLMEEALQEIFK